MSPSREDRMAGMEGRPDRAGPAAVTLRLAAIVEDVAAVALDELDHAELERFLDALRGPITRLEAVRARGFASLERGAARRAPAGGAAAAELEQRRRTGARQRMSPSAMKRAAEAGRAAIDHAATGAAFQAGAVDPEHVRLIGSLLRQVRIDRRRELEGQLLELATQLEPVAFGRKARELIAREEPDAARRTEQRAHDRRSVRAADTPDGGFAFSGLLHGSAAETARVAFQAFRRPNTPDEHRTPEQASADAFEQLCEAALRSGSAPTVHGVRPHVIVVIDEDQLDRDTGVARLAHSAQPVTTAAIGHLLADATVSRLVRGLPGTPLEASEGSRTVPAGLWKALLARDGGCTWPGCDAPAAWCDVAHGQQAFRHGGRLSPDNAALLCRRHHRRFDGGPYRMLIDGGQVRYHRLPPTSGAAAEQLPAPESVEDGMITRPTRTTARSSVDDEERPDAGVEGRAGPGLRRGGVEGRAGPGL
ncbi:MAG: DUF222 domain-containing protein, partial [Nitriliruptoraceae bacterium]